MLLNLPTLHHLVCFQISLKSDFVPFLLQDHKWVKTSVQGTYLTYNIQGPFFQVCHSRAWAVSGRKEGVEGGNLEVRKAVLFTEEDQFY